MRSGRGGRRRGAGRRREPESGEEENREDEIDFCTACDNCLELLIQQSPIGCCTYNKTYTDILVQTRKEKGKLKQNHT